jgi:hypothetical protein
MSMKTVSYRSAEVDAELEAPAPWWKRLWLRFRAWQRVRRERRSEEPIAFMLRLERLERTVRSLGTEPPPLRAPGPGRKRLG